jgi:hypothetical protein
MIIRYIQFLFNDINSRVGPFAVRGLSETAAELFNFTRRMIGRDKYSFDMEKKRERRRRLDDVYIYIINRT